jgi:predicted lipoprotein with Yx(FWY)xxD motif
MWAAALIAGLGVVMVWGSSSLASAAPSHTFSLGTTHVAKVGMVLTTPSGLTLYRFTDDTRGHATCTGACAKVWPPLLVPKGDHLKAAKGVTGLGGIRVGHGRVQATLHGVALYRFSGDTKRGQDKGQGIEGTWFAVLASGSGADITTPTSAPGAGSTPSSVSTTTAPTSVSPGTPKTTTTSSKRSTTATVPPTVPQTTTPAQVPVTSPPTTQPAAPVPTPPPTTTPTTQPAPAPTTTTTTTTSPPSGGYGY